MARGARRSDEGSTFFLLRSRSKSTPCMASSILEQIGRTPLVNLPRLPKLLGLPPNSLFAKCENANPGGSKKDRVALRIIEDAKESRRLAPGQPIVELTSGNTGTGLAIVSKALGHDFHAVMSLGNTPERAAAMAALGATVHLIPQHKNSKVGQVSGADVALVEAAAQKLTSEKGYFRADQFKEEVRAFSRSDELRKLNHVLSRSIIDASAH